MGKQLIKKSMRKLKMPAIVRPFETKENIILRDFLALERTTLANERTLFAYIRTSLYLILGGVAFLQIRDFSHLKWLGYVSFSISIFLIAHGLLRYWALRRKLHKFYARNDLENIAIKDRKSE